MEKKKGLIQKLVVGSRNNETGYIMRALQVQCSIGHLTVSSYLEDITTGPPPPQLQSHPVLWMLQGKLRIGLAEQTVLVALAQAVLLHKQADRDNGGKLAGQLEEAAQTVKYVYSQCPSYDQLIPALLNNPVSVSTFS